MTGEKVTVGRVAAAADVEYMTAAVAEQRGLQLHIVPELEVMRVGLRGDEISVEQKLPDGKVVTIAANRRVGEERDFAAKSMAALAAPARVRNEGVAEGARARDRQQLLREAAETSVEVNRGALRLRISGVLSEDSLRALAAKIR